LIRYSHRVGTGRLDPVSRTEVFLKRWNWRADRSSFGSGGAGRAVEKVVVGLPDRCFPTKISQLCAQRLGLVIDLDDAVSTAVVELAVLDGGVLAEQLVVSGRSGRLVERIDEESAAPGCKALAYQTPERREVLGRYMREPEAEVDDVVALFGFPGEEVGLQIANSIVGDALAVDLQYFGSGIESGQ